MQPGDKFGIILVPNGTIEEVQENPEITGNKRPLFSLATANPLDAFHVGQIADVTGEGNLFVMEDLRVDVGSDRDYNDLIFSLFGATGTVTVLDELINPNLDWRTTDTGQEIITYVQEKSALLQSNPESASDEVSETIDALEPSDDEIAASDSTPDIDSTDSGVESTSSLEEIESETLLSDDTIVEPTESTSTLEETESETLLSDDNDNEIESTSVSTDTSPSIVSDSDTSNPTESTSVSTETSEPSESSDETSSGTDSDTVEPTESNLDTSSSIQSDSLTTDDTDLHRNESVSISEISGNQSSATDDTDLHRNESVSISEISGEQSLTTDDTDLHRNESVSISAISGEQSSTTDDIDLHRNESVFISEISGEQSLTTDDTDLHRNESVSISEISGEQSFPNFSQGVFLVGETGSINIEYLFDGGYYQSTVGLFNMANLSEYEWGSPEFFQEIARRSLSNSEEGYVLLDDSTEAAKLDGKLEAYNWNRGIKQGEKTFSLPSGTEFGLILIPDGTLQELFDNPQVTGSKKPFLSLTPTDPERALHQTQLVDVTGEGSLFAWEDLRLPGGDTDFNDITFKMSGATGIVTEIDEVIPPGSDWRDSEVGREIINEIQIEPPNSDKEPPIVTAQLFSDNSGNEPFNPVVRGSITDASPIIRLRAGFDETPVEEFVDVTAYLQADGSFELDRQILEQILGNSLDGNTHVLHLISEDAGRLIGVKAIRVGNLVPENDAELNQALAEFYGLDPYPDSLTLVAGTTRQLSLTINELESRPNITATETGTRYFVSHPDLLEVDEDGLVTALDEGEATITMIHGAQMVTIPISIQKPLAGSVTLGEEGGVVEAVDGSLVMIPPGGLEAETAVSLTPLLRESLSLPLPESLDLVGAFSLDLGDEPLTQPAQLAIPAPAGLSAGSEVLFLRKSSLPDETGTWNPTWSIEEADVVDEEGIIRTTSWPFNGILASGQYAVLTWPSAGLGTLGFVETGISQITASQLATRTVGGINLTGNLSLATSSFIAHAGWFSVAALTYGQFVATAYLLAYLAKYLQTDLEIIGIPQVGLPVVTTAGVELTAEGIPSVTAVLDTPPPRPADPLAPPVLQQAELTFSNNEPVVVLNGSNFLNDFNGVGSSFEDLAVEFRVGDKSYPGILIPDRSVELGDNLYEIAIEVPNIVALGEAEIVLIRRQKEQMGSLPTDSEIVEKESNPIQLTPTCVELALVAKETADAIGIINAHAPESVIEAGSSSDLLRVNIPVGTLDREDKPVELAATSNATRAYVLLQESGRLGLVDLMTWRQVDTNSETPEIDPIDLPPGASPQSIALDPGDNYAYIADGKIGAVYILDINPNSATYHEVIQTISLPSASWGLRQLSIGSDSRKLFVAVPDYSWPFLANKGQIHVINIDPRDRPSNLENNPRLWHEKIGSFSTYSEVDGVFAKNNGSIAFTNSRRESAGFGVVEILNDNPLDFTVGTPRYASLGLGNFLDYFDINWATSVDILRDGSYAFVAAKNNSSQTGVESIDGPRSGSNIGIIKDPFGPNPKLVAATRPIPGGKTTDLVLSSDEKYLYVSYPGLELSDSTDRGGIFVFDVEEMIATVENPGNFWLDSLNRGIGSVGFNENAKRLASESDLGNVPIDDINPDISVAADYEIIGGNWRYDFTFGVPEDTIKSPVGIGGMPTGLTLVSASKPLQLVSPGISGVADSLTPTFEWKFGDEEEDDVCGAIDPDEVKEVRLYVSVFPKGEGLLPGDTWRELDSPTPGMDYNPNRILTATWKEGVWTWNGGSQAGTKDQFTLRDDRMLTAGQEYYWAVEAVTTEGEIGRTVTGRFETALSESFNDGRFSSVTVLTRGVEPDNSGESINSQINALASKIQKAGGSVMKYNPSTGGWQSVTLNGNRWVATNATPMEEKPLVLLADWMQGVDASSFYNAGFAEAAADSMFASLVKLDQQYGGKVGEGSRLYDANGNLIRTQGDIFNSPLHFIGLGQGAVVNTEIIQRLGTYFPHAGGTNASNRDLQMTTIDPYDFRDNFQVEEFNNLRDPEVVVWDNVTYADNYYQEQGFGNTLTGRKLSSSKWTADWNIELNELAQFDRNPTTGGPHQAAAAWYAGTANLNLNKIPSENGQTIYRRLGDLSSSERPWYSPDHTNANFSHGEEVAPWEGIGTGWFHSVLGGGNQLRPYNYEGGKWSKDEIQEFSYPNNGWREYLETKRVSVEQENNPIPGMWGDFAVPTLFNGNFDAIVYKYSSQNIPSWYIDTPTNSLKQSALIDVAGIPGSTPYSNGLPNYALQLGGGNPTQATHDWFMVPDWGNLRFDVFAPVESGELNVKLETIEGQSKNVTIALDRDADFLIDETNSREIPIVKEIYSEIENQIGFGRKGFETFQLKLHLSDSEIADFRGKPAKISFSLQGGDFVYIDNVFFKSDFLKIANPTEAKWNLESSTSVNNLLLEKPQYALSYNADTKVANWVGWKVDKTWATLPQAGPESLPTGLLQRPEFIADPDLLASGLSSYDANIFTGLGMDRGHLAPDRDRLRHPKDQLATYLTTNLIAQSMDNNRFFIPNSNNPKDASAWFNIEEKVVDERATQGEELYIFAGAFGQNSQPQKKTNVPELLDDVLNEQYINMGNTNPGKLVSQEIHIPRWTWKTIIAVEQPGADITSSNIEGFAYITPNTAEPDWNNVSSEGIANPLNVFSQFLNNNRGNITNPTDWRNPDTWRVTIPELTHILNERNRVRDYDFNFDFLSNLPESIQQTLNS